MTLAAFHAAVDGFLAAHSPNNAGDVSADEYAAILAEEMAAGRA